jgi:heat shock protein HslJ
MLHAAIGLGLALLGSLALGQTSEEVKAVQDSAVPTLNGAILKTFTPNDKMVYHAALERVGGKWMWAVYTRSRTGLRGIWTDPFTGDSTAKTAALGQKGWPQPQAMPARTTVTMAIAEASKWKGGFTSRAHFDGANWIITTWDGFMNPFELTVSGNTPLVKAWEPGIVGPVWQLVEIQSMDDTKVEIDEPSKYELTLGPEGRYFIRADVNRGSGTYTLKNPSLELRPGPLTMAAPGPDSHHDRYLKELGFVRSFVMKDGHLYLATMADGAILKFQRKP